MVAVIIGAAAVMAAAVITAYPVRRHSRQVDVLRAENTAQHAQSYSLLESIDKRTISMDSKLDEHGERIAKVETEVEHLKGYV